MSRVGDTTDVIQRTIYKSFTKYNLKNKPKQLWHSDVTFDNNPPKIVGAKVEPVYCKG